MPDGLRLLHLSDIHFLGSSDAAIARNRDLRSELERDLDRLATELGAVDAILIGGDLAYSGFASQYEEAEEWLHRICDMTRCKTSAIFSVPGNHDVDISRLEVLHTNLHEQLRECDPGAITSRLENLWAAGEQHRDLLFDSISAYNDFAYPYGCKVGPDSPCWQQFLPLSTGLELRITGLTSTLVSSRKDSVDSHPLLVGECQVANMMRDPGLVDLVICHHPPEWLRDWAEIEPYLSRAAVQVFGHKHQFKTDDLEDGSVRISAGAVHPNDREPGWEPRYNLIELREIAEETRRLGVDIYPRVWDKAKTEFVGPDGTHAPTSEPHEVPIASTPTPVATASPPAADGVDGEREIDPAVTPTHVPEASELAEEGIDLRDLVYRFLNLPFSVRVQLSTELGLLDPAELSDYSEHGVFEQVFLRARENDRLQEMQDKVRERGETK